MNPSRMLVYIKQTILFLFLWLEQSKQKKTWMNEIGGLPKYYCIPYHDVVIGRGTTHSRRRIFLQPIMQQPYINAKF